LTSVFYFALRPIRCVRTLLRIDFGILFCFEANPVCTHATAD
jgi:hypothetical protein